MAIPKSSIKKRGKVFYLRYSENGQRKRVSLQTDSLEEAKEKQRQFDSARARREGDIFPTKASRQNNLTLLWVCYILAACKMQRL